MKIINKVLAVAIVVVASSYSAQGQSNTTAPNGNYKHQIPSSKGHKFKDSFRNDNVIDLSSDNYKQPKYKKVKETPFKNNFSAVQKTSTVNSKHPYGL